jgi:dienelactone hydrolase
MTLQRLRRNVFLVLSVLTMTSLLPGIFNTGLVSAESLDSTINEQVIMLPVTVHGVAFEFETTLFKPPGDGPFPLLLMNHGKERGDPHKQKRDRFLAISREFVKRGYAVAIPMRRGFSRSTGSYTDFGCNMAENGRLQADDIEAALTALTKIRWIDREQIIVGGQSYGGLAAMAFGVRPYPGVRALLNFSGGLRIDGQGCDWKNSLVQAFASYSRNTSLPSLWFYGENDSYFDHKLARQLYSAYQSAGSIPQLYAFGKFKNDAHGMAGSHDGVSIWLPETESFLHRVGLPISPIIDVANSVRPAATNYSELDNVSAIPYLSNAGRLGYRDYLKKTSPRAFALSASGQWSWASEGDDPADRALVACQKNSTTPCKLYSIDNDVVWSESVTDKMK